MKVIVAGSRTITNIKFVEAAIAASSFTITELVSGAARGVDQLGELWAFNNKIPIQKFRANWNEHGRMAGMIRNVEMANYADALIAIWDGKSKGTKHMIWTAQKNKLKVHVYNVGTNNTCPPLPSLTTGDYS